MEDVESWTEALDRDLAAALGLHRAPDVRAWLDPEVERCYLPKAGARFAHHFDLKPEFLIRDSALGTLGLVHFVRPPGAPQPPDSPPLPPIEEQVRRFVDNATYARHLLLRDPERRDAPPFAVELVLVGAPDAGTRSAIGHALRDLLRSTDSLFDVGIGLLFPKTAEEQEAARQEGLEKEEQAAVGPFGGRLRRAFPWLLTATRRWQESARSKPPGANGATPPPRLKGIALSNFRLPGTRALALAPSPVHLVHGANGSGKSSLVEALELVACGSVERLTIAGDDPDYVHVIRNRAADEGERASIILDRGTGPSVWHVVSRGVEPSPAAPVHASSFRLDQPLMDRLIGTAAHERANHYLKAFFPEEAVPLERYAEASRARAERLPALEAEAAVLKTARDALESLRDWRGGASRSTTETFPDVLNRWLERTALADLAVRELRVRESLADARSEGWALHQEASEGVLGPVEVTLDSLRGQHQRWTAEAERLQQELASFRPAATPAAQAAQAALVLTQQQCDALNLVSPWLFESSVLESDGPFGDRLTNVLAGGGPRTYGAVVIGDEGWTVPVIGQIEALASAIDGLVNGGSARAWPGKKEWPAYKDAEVQHEAYLAASASLSAGFVDVLRVGGFGRDEFDGSLIGAVNELMALFTPARWGYEDILLPATLNPDNGRLTVGFGLQTNAAVRAELHLNTAQLNLFTIALFLLCSGRVPKTLGLLVLDDPLQNMDEVTSTALARGLARVVRAWQRAGRRDELLFLFHGAEDLQRFQDELGGASYRLPWLSPGPEPKDLPITAAAKPPRVSSVQDLAKLVEPIT